MEWAAAAAAAQCCHHDDGFANVLITRAAITTAEITFICYGSYRLHFFLYFFFARLLSAVNEIFHSAPTRSTHGRPALIFSTPKHGHDAAKMSKTYKEDEISIRVDRCLYDSAIKFAGGLTVGAVASLLFFKRRKWPLIMGSGFGLGLAYENCEKDLKEYFTST